MPSSPLPYFPCVNNIPASNNTLLRPVRISGRYLDTWIGQLLGGGGATRQIVTVNQILLLSLMPLEAAAAAASRYLLLLPPILFYYYSNHKVIISLNRLSMSDADDSDVRTSSSIYQSPIVDVQARPSRLQFQRGSFEYPARNDRPVVTGQER